MLLLRQQPTLPTRDAQGLASTSSRLDRNACRPPSAGVGCPRLQCPSASRHQSSLLASGSSSATMSVAPSPSTPTTEDRMAEEYNKTMAHAMKWGPLDPFEYHPQRGLYWHEVAPGLICGTQPRSGQDVAVLAECGVTHILNLQTDKDMQHWGVNVKELETRCKELGVVHMRRSARDFDPLSLRKTLPSAVAAVHSALHQPLESASSWSDSRSDRSDESGSEGEAAAAAAAAGLEPPVGRVYVHCTAGLGRAPAVCIAYMYWFLGLELDVAYKTLTDIRPCGPKRDAIRGATFDLMSGQAADHFERLGRDAWASLAEEDRYALQWRVMRGGAA